ncbi:3'(2'),5'-bisphosphate nucleotidase CysQ [Vreelandella aquamarina]|uniref:3'(2'),5'-bisphosphate nucleotidase CysQ n=1 Tax=Vreelandella aquamarina TaxID=77097 RepID=UPI00384F98BB
MDELLKQVLAIANEAGDAIMKIYGNEYRVDIKEDHSPVTEADYAAHHVILTGLQALQEKLPVLSEEDTGQFVGVSDSQRYWLVDPLDGTKEFIKKNDEFTVNIALIEDGSPILGVVCVPALSVAYVAAKGKGAYKIDRHGHRQPLSIAGSTKHPEVWRVVSSRSHKSPELYDWLSQLGKYEISLVGSSLKFCLIAEGSADVYPRFGPTCLWDTAAAQVIIEEAGGSVQAMGGGPLRYGNPVEIINPSFVVWGAAKIDIHRMLS